MPPRRKTKATSTAFPTAYAYRFFTDIFSDFMVWTSVRSMWKQMVVLVTNETTSIIPLFYAGTPKPPSLQAKLDRKRVRVSTWFEKFIIVRVMQENVDVSKSPTNTCPHHVTRWISLRVFQFNNITFLDHLFRYRTGITTKMKCMVVERANNYVPALFVPPSWWNIKQRSSHAVLSATWFMRYA